LTFIQKIILNIQFNQNSLVVRDPTPEEEAS